MTPRIHALAFCLGLVAASASLPATAESWSFAPSLSEVKQRSCAAPITHDHSIDAKIAVTALDLSSNPHTQFAKGVRLNRAWKLDGSAPFFGGLSGLAYRTDKKLLTISDRGAFVELDMRKGQPTGAVTVAAMYDEGGTRLNDRPDHRDAEGLALYQGLALVSFEGQHRVMAFNLGDCGFRARGIELVSVAEKLKGLTEPMGSNSGMEGLAITAGGQAYATLEQNGSRVPLLVFQAAQPGYRVESLAAPAVTEAVGLDLEGETVYSLHRSYSRLSGNVIKLFCSPLGSRTAERLLTLDTAGPVDNFEGIEVTEDDAGGRRALIISDDNFSWRQETLLFDFTLPGSCPP